MFGINEDKIGTAAGVSAMAELKNNPDLINAIVAALVAEVVKSIPAIIAGVAQGIAEVKAKAATK